MASLWIPSAERKRDANVTRFIEYVNKERKLGLSSYRQLYNWSVEDIPAFWAAMWEFADIKASRSYDAVVDNLAKFPGAKWFTGARLNFTENILSLRDDRTAIVSVGENQRPTRITYSSLFRSVALLAKSLQNMGVAPGDRVVAYMPNIAHTIIAMLASTSLGGIWSSCGTEVGPRSVLDRFGQINPKVLFAVDGYQYKGKKFDMLPNVESVGKGMLSLEKTIVVPYAGETSDLSRVPESVFYDDFVLQEEQVNIEFEQLPFEHPVYIMFSSGTTGKPKCMVQGAGGILINHLKELLLHTDLKRDDKICYITTPSWMMWNWVVSSLALGATLVLYDGNPTYPDWGTMWQLIQNEGVTVFGCSASYINYLKSVGAEPGKTYDLSLLREISQTGSALSSDGFEYVYEKIKKDLHFNSISGGTDINGCFAAGTPIQPVYAGELQSPALGMKVSAFDEGGGRVFDKEGELVAEAPSPSMPLYFWNDPEGKKYKDAYFSVYPDVWRHGDWVIFHSDTGGITFLGRSDFTLKPSGVRIGPAEIYNVVEKFQEVADCLAVGQDWQGDQRIILFVQMRPEFELTEDLTSKIKSALRKEASPRHVPAVIIGTPGIPYTLNMKKVESAVANILNGKPVLNRDSLQNPDVLDFYEDIAPELQKE